MRSAWQTGLTKSRTLILLEGISGGQVTGKLILPAALGGRFRPPLYACGQPNLSPQSLPPVAAMSKVQAQDQSPESSHAT